MIMRQESYNQPPIHFESKGWGFEKWIINKDDYCGKLLYIVKGRRCSLHYHQVKDETFYLQSGRLRVHFSDDLELLQETKKEKENNPGMSERLLDLCDTYILEPGDNFYVPRGRVHQMVAELDSELFEFSTHHEDSDSYRIVKGD